MIVVADDGWADYCSLLSFLTDFCRNDVYGCARDENLAK